MSGRDWFEIAQSAVIVYLWITLLRCRDEIADLWEENWRTGSRCKGWVDGYHRLWGRAWVQPKGQEPREDGAF